MKIYIEKALASNQAEAVDYLNRNLRTYAHQAIDYGYIEKEFISSDWGADIFYLKLLQDSVVTEDPRHQDKGKEALDIYLKQHSDAEIEWDEVVDKQWIRIVWDRWYLPREVRVGRTPFTNSHLEAFCKVLNQSSYPDEREVVINDFQQKINMHQAYYPNMPKYNELIEEKIVYKVGHSYILNIEHPLFKAYANKIFAQLWSESHSGPKNPLDRLTWWMNYMELSRWYGNQFLKHLTHDKRILFLDAAWEQVLKERDLIGWDNEQRRRSAEEQPFSNTQPLEDNVPEALPDRLAWIIDDSMEHLLTVNDARERIGWLLSLIISSEFTSSFERDKLNRFNQLLDEAENRPFFFREIYYEATHHTPELIPALLTSTNYPDLGLILLSEFSPSMNSLEEKNKEELKEKWWSIGLSFFAYTITQQDIDSASLKIFNVAKWLFQDNQAAAHSLSHNEQKLNLTEYRISTFLKKLEGLSNIQSQDKFISSMISVLFPLLKDKISKDKAPLSSFEYYFMLWLIQQIATHRLEKTNFQDILNDGAILLQGGYVRSLTSPGYGSFTYLMGHQEWIFWAKVLHHNHSVLWSQLINCFYQLDKKRNLEYINKLRSHFKLLCSWIVNWEKVHMEDCPADLLSAFEQLLQYQEDNIAKGMVDIFSPLYEIGINSNKQLPLYYEAINVISHLKGDTHDRIVQQLIKITTKPDRLSLLLTEVAKNKGNTLLIMEKIPEINAEKLNLFEAKQIISSFIDSQQPRLIKESLKLLDHFDGIIQTRKISDWTFWSFSHRLKALYLDKKTKSILQMKIPDSILYIGSAKKALSFYQGLSYLSSLDKQEIQKGVETFEQLRDQDASNVSFAINYYAARVRYITANIEDPISKEKAQEIQELLSLGEDIRGEFLDKEWDEVNNLYVENQLFLYLLILDWENFWSLYWSLDIEFRENLTVGSYAVHAYMAQGNEKDAHNLLRKLKEKHGDIEHLQQFAKTALPPEHLDDISLAIFRMQNSNPSDQIKAITGNKNMDIKQFLIRIIADTCRTVCHILPSITTGVKGALDEDRYTDIFLSHFAKEIKLLRWTIKGQDRGGFTGKEPINGHGGVGERDGILYDSSGNPLALIEALVLNHVDTKKIEIHTEKIFGYDTTGLNLYFVINWGVSKNPAYTWNEYRDIVVSRQSGLFAVEHSGEITDFSSSNDIEGLNAFYTLHKTTKENKPTVIHLYVDVNKGEEKAIAQQARDK